MPIQSQKLLLQVLFAMCNYSYFCMSVSYYYCHLPSTTPPPSDPRLHPRHHPRQLTPIDSPIHLPHSHTQASTMLTIQKCNAQAACYLIVWLAIAMNHGHCCNQLCQSTAARKLQWPTGDNILTTASPSWRLRCAPACHQAGVQARSQGA